MKQIGDLQLVLQKVKAEMERKQSTDMRIRDRKELIVFVVVATCCVIYGCVALLTRGFI
jgi:hypothetical protein